MMRKARAAKPKRKSHPQAAALNALLVQEDAEQLELSDGADELLLSSDESSSDEGGHVDLLAAITRLTSKRSKPPQRSEPSATISDFHLEPSQPAEVSVTELVKSLKGTKGYADLTKKLKLSDAPSKLDPPLAKHQADQIQRVVSYRDSSQEVSRWQPIVKRNREADHLSFPLQESFVPAADLSSLVNSFEPRTPLEVEIASLLKGSESVQETAEGLTVAEKKVVEKMNLEEAKQRRRELQKMRALVTFQEQKFRREKRIKSKKFHKMQRKAKEKKQLQQPTTGADDVEKAERLRAKERISLKHSAKSKWSQRVLSRNHKDPVTRQAVAEQRRVGQQLKQKQAEASSDSADDELGEGLLLLEEGEEGLHETSDNPWMGHASTSSHTPPVVTPGNSSDVVASLQAGAPPTSSAEAPPTSSAGDYDDHQLDHIREAFADDGVIEEFEKEKRTTIEQEQPKVPGKDQEELPGWGNWAGEGAPPPKKLRRKKEPPKQEPPVNERKDASLKHVIIRESRDKRASKHLVKAAAFPFTSTEQFEATQRVPLGRLWNSEDSHRHLITPRVSVEAGCVIPPLEATHEIEEEFRKFTARRELTKKIVARKKKQKKSIQT